MDRQLWFTSSLFAPITGEEEKTNPGRFGQALAIWLQKKLIAQIDVSSEAPIPEDWGWVVMVQRKPYPLWIGCGNEDGSIERWNLFVEAEVSLFQKIFKRLDPALQVNSLEQLLEELIKAEAECTDMSWDAA